MTMKLIDPMKFKNLHWPKVRFYSKQIDLIYSIMYDDETYSVAGNMLGKDYVAGFIALWAFCQRCETRVVTTSVKDDHLRVLWGEIKRFIRTSEVELPFTAVNHREIKKRVYWDDPSDPNNRNGQECDISYLIGTVSEGAEGLSGHHAEFTLMIGDEATGMSDKAYEAGQGWMKRGLFITNPNPTTNFVYRAVEGNPAEKDPGGDIPKDNGKGYHRRIIHIKAEDSPNVRRGLMQERQGIEPDNRQILPGVLTYNEYKKRRKMWDKIRQCIGLDAKFYRGAELLMYPPDWLDHSHSVAAKLQSTRKGEAMGVDSAEGGDDTCWTIVDRLGLIHLHSIKTEDTTEIVRITKDLISAFNVPHNKVIFDRGGGGKQHADRLRKEGYKVRTVAFGESTKPQKKRGMKTFAERLEEEEEQYAYKNRRAQMYHWLRRMIDPMTTFRDDILPGPFGIPEEYGELRRQMAPLPLLYDPEGRILLPPKDKVSQNSNIVTIKEMLGCSPDQSDSLVLATFGLLTKPTGSYAAVL